MHYSWSGKGVYLRVVLSIVGYTHLLEWSVSPTPVGRLVRSPPDVESCLQLSYVRCTVLLINARAGRESTTVRWAPLSRISLLLYFLVVAESLVRLS